MSDLISRQAAVEELEWTWAGKAAFDAIKNLPSAQPEIIRCKDCKHYMYPHGCNHIDGMTTAQEDGYCSYAERRES